MSVMLEIEAVKSMRRSGYTYSQIAETYGVTKNSIAGFIRRKVRGVPVTFDGRWQDWHARNTRVPSLPPVPAPRS